MMVSVDWNLIKVLRLKRVESVSLGDDAAQTPSIRLSCLTRNIHLSLPFLSYIPVYASLSGAGIVQPR